MKENELNLNEIIIVEQLPKIKQQLQIISDEVDKEIEYALSLECNDDNVKEVKNARARLNKIKTTMEDKRKQVKNAVLNPYNEFETIYNDLVKNKLASADTTLKEKIDSVENQLKQQKEDELREFVKQHCQINKINVDFGEIGLNITLSASMKSLKEQAKAFIERVANDLKLIELEQYSSEILYEYNKNGLDFANAKIKVIERHKRLEEIQKQQEMKQEQEKQEEQVVEKVDEIVAPKEIIEDDELITVSFKVTGTKEKIKKIKELIIELEVEYE